MTALRDAAEAMARKLARVVPTEWAAERAANMAQGLSGLDADTYHEAWNDCAGMLLLRGRLPQANEAACVVALADALIAYAEEATPHPVDTLMERAEWLSACGMPDALFDAWLVAKSDLETRQRPAGRTGGRVVSAAKDAARLTIDLDNVEPTQEQLRAEHGRGLNDVRECPWCLRTHRQPGMPRCHGCWEVQGHLVAFLHSEAGREYVRRALAEAEL